jgi:hypothetical protein
VRTTLLIVSLSVVATACSNGTGTPMPLGTIQFEDSVPTDILVHAVDSLARVPLDTFFEVPARSRACLALTTGRLSGDFIATVRLDVFDPVSAAFLASASVSVANESWTWDVLTPPKVGARCVPA